MNTRIPFMLFAVINLIAGIWSGLLKIGWNLPVSTMAVHHGAIMVGGFLTTLIALEKVIPLKKKLGFVVPVMSALSLVMVIPGYYQIGLYLLLLGSIGLFLIQAYYVYLYPRELPMILMGLGAAALIVGNVMLIKLKFYPAAFPWWMGFLLFTITAERLELSRFLPVTRATKFWLLLFLAGYLVGVTMPFHTFGRYLSGVACLLISIWMLRHDIIRIGIRKQGLTQFSSVALLLANVWLMITGLLLLLPEQSPYAYDMIVHSFFIGYTLSMIFAHGPIILPGVLGVQGKPFHPILYGGLGLLQLSLVVRLTADAWIKTDWRALSGILSSLAIVVYLGTLAVLVFRHHRSTRTP